MIPSNKEDTEAISLLEQASDKDVLKVADKLLEWLQDRNWPVFDSIVSRLSPLGIELEVPITKILEGSDSIWKGNIIGHLIPSFSKKAQKLYTPSLEILLKQFNEEDLYEGVIDFTEIQLANVKRNT